MMRPLTRAGALVICLTATGPGYDAFAEPQIASPAAQSTQAAQSATLALPNTKSLPWQGWARSAEGRPIEMVRLGTGSHQVLVIAALRGDDALAVELAEHLAAHLIEYPSLVAATTVTIVRDANPDGRARRTATNSHGVLLEHNFSSSNWRKLPQAGEYLSGRLPESEPETRALAELIAQCRPQRVLVLSTVSTKPALFYAGPRADWPGKFALEAKLSLAAIDLASTSGSPVVYLGQDRAIPCVLAQLPRARDIATLWPKVRRGLSTAVSDGFTAPVLTPPPQVPLVTVAPGSTQVMRVPPVTSATTRVVAAPLASSEQAAAEPHRPFSFLLRDVREVAPPPAKPATAGPRVLSAEELTSGGSLVPVARPEAAQPSPADVPAGGASPFGRRPNRVEIRGDAKSAPAARTGNRSSSEGGETNRPPAVPVVDERALPQPPIPHGD